MKNSTSSNDQKQVQKFVTAFYIGSVLLIAAIAYYFFFVNPLTNH